MNNDLEERIKTILSGRKIHSWGNEIGLTRGIIHKLNQGKLPGADKLGPIIRAENVSISWLIEGVGHPYLVNNCVSDIDCYDTLENLYDEDWNTYLVTDGVQIAIVLMQPGGYTVNKVDYLYTIVEVIVGAIGPRALERVATTANGENIHLALTSSTTMNKLQKGQIGTYQLLKAENGVLKTATLIIGTGSPEFKKYKELAEKPQPYGGGKVSTDEMATVEELRRLDSQNLAHIRAVIRTLADKAGGEAGKG